MRKLAWALYLSVLVAGLCVTGFTLWLSPLQAQDDVIAAKDVATCLGCHGEAIDAAKMKASAHGALVCQDCHRGIDRFPHPEKAVAKKPACATCHANETKRLTSSVHRAGGKVGKPTCQSCHGASAHAIPVASTQSTAKQDAACATCHAAAVASMKKTPHGQPGLNGAPRATCRNCHENDPHAITAPSKTAVQGACRSCHNDVAATLAGSVHKNQNLACFDCHAGAVHALQPAPIPTARVDTACRRCHTDQAKALATTAHNGSNCRDCHDASAHGVQPPAQAAAAKSARCATCHTDVAQAMADSIHGHAQPKDGVNPPTCVSCHGDNMHNTGTLAAMKAQPRDAACRKCHGGETQDLTNSVHRKAFTGNGKPVSCFACHGSGPHAVHKINAGTTAQIVGMCKRCHTDKVAMPGTSKHDNPDIVAGDHPNCLTCHATSIHNSGVAHGISKPPTPNPVQQVEICSKCHADEKLMARYKMNTEAVSSYLQSFHGRSVVNFHDTNSATCTECHGLHAVMAPEAPQSPVNQANVEKTCRQCHAGAKLNFAMSGANHLRLKIENNPILRIEELAFMWLIYGAMCFLFIMVLLDLRRKLFDPANLPECGKFVTILISAGLLSLVFGIIFAYMRVPKSWIWWVASVVIAVVAYSINHFRRKPHAHAAHGGKMYQRFTVAQRWQHGLLALSFTLLVLTGFPLHFAHVQWTHYILMPFGGLGGARIVHRFAGLLMVTNWIWHLGFLLYRWKLAKFSLKSWSMFPGLKDIRDVVDYFKWGLGLRKNLPEWERFQFREKFDYFADIWGTIVMGSTGFLLWFPVVLGNMLPDWAFGFAYIAHSYEGTLALMAILIWHFYNTHFNPDMFPMNPVWWTGTMTEEEMEREHPLEKARIDAESGDALLNK